MLIDLIVDRLEATGALESFWAKLDETNFPDAAQDATLSVASTARPMLIAATFARNPRSTLVVVPGEKTAELYARNITSFIGTENVITFPARTDVLWGAKQPNAATMAKRAQACWALQTGKKCVVVASAKSLVRTLPPANAKTMQPLVLRAGDELCDIKAPANSALESLHDVFATLEGMGYVNTGKLDGPSTFCYKGDVLDVYPGNTPYPVRIDFFGDEIEEIRRIVPATGQTISNLSVIEIYPVVEFPLTDDARQRACRKLKKQKNMSAVLEDLLDALEADVPLDNNSVLLPWVYGNTTTLGAYMQKSALSVLVEPRAVFDDAAHTCEDEMARLTSVKNLHDGFLETPSAINFGDNQRATILSIMKAGHSVDSALSLQRVDVVGNSEKLFGKVKTLLNSHNVVIFSVPNYRARKEMMLQFVEAGIAVQDLSAGARGGDAGARGSSAGSGDTTRLRGGVVNITDTEIPQGMIITAAKMALVSIYDTQRFNSASAHVRSNIDITQITFPYKPGDYVVHAHHGIAYFKDLVKQEIAGVVRDYLLLEYAEEDKLYVPVEQLDRVTKYVGPQGAAPRLTRLNTSDWSRAMTRARKASKKLAFDLVDVYTRRSAAKGFAFSPDTFAQREMEDAFPYTETPDQKRAIEDVKADMEAARPMDRLICGDVGFGKTEVAMRAAFKAIQDEKQVIVLCPTTILAQQHFNSFSERFEPFGVSVEVLSRFRTPTQQKAALEGFKSGSVQVLVGTHRLLSRDVCPHDLGLVIVDEEQRFGVGHKEQLKNLRESVDVLTLSATPIPRTLQMSLSGVRDMSLILTPPQDRLPVEVYAGEWDADLVSAAIRREVQRGGQVYYVSNRVKSIEDAQERVLGAAEEVRLGVAHGQMNKDELESVMESFCAGQLDVLVATTIIESGIDNPHTNTLIIEDSQRLGLAQMYQLKGRVGRSNTQAYAYFMFPAHVNLTEEATARLSALCEHTQLGSGMRIAMRDLEIRGSGSLLGAEQSGNVSSVGFDLYAQMLEEALRAEQQAGSVGGGAAGEAGAVASGNGASSGAKSGAPRALSDISINIAAHAYFPDEYIPDVDERVMWYRRAANCASAGAAENLRENLLEAHPDIPDAAENLLVKTKIKALANEHGITNITAAGGKLTIEPVPTPIITREKLAEYKKLRARYIKDKRAFVVPTRTFSLTDSETLLEPTLELLEGLFA